MIPQVNDVDAISIHVPREGHDSRPEKSNGKTFVISIHVPREGHDLCPEIKTDYHSISIHVPREGHDAKRRAETSIPTKISIHVPREGHDLSMVWIPPRPSLFQSTCPARGTTGSEQRLIQ